MREAVLFLSGFRQRNLYGASYRVKKDITLEDLAQRCDHVVRGRAGNHPEPADSELRRFIVELTRNGVPYEIGVARYREIARGQIIGDTVGMLKLLFHSESRELLGVHVIGEGATELVHIGQAVIAHRGKLDYFVDAVFNYPTLAECYKVAALAVLTAPCNVAPS